MSGVTVIRHPLLDAVGVPHGFGLRDAPRPEGLVVPRQVHGIAVATLRADGTLDREEADAVLATQCRVPVGVVTADCVPVLATSGDGRVVAAMHAGWRGLAAGVLGEGVEAVRREGGGREGGGGQGGEGLRAVVGPCIGSCCYEVDEPVLAPLRARFGVVAVAAASQATRPGHARLDLGALALRDLADQGVEAARVEGACTRCDALRFHSYRRDGERAGRLAHWIVPMGEG